MGKKEQHEPYIVDDQEWISSWLRDADHQECEKGVSKLGDVATMDPITPPRRVSLPAYYEEVSPTNTSFSGDSIFDTPTSADDGSIEDPFTEGDPDTAPVDILGWGTSSNEDRSCTAGQISIDTDHSEADSLASYDSPSEVANRIKGTQDLSGETSREATAPLVDPDKPRPTWLTSCTQCIHADLPCSRKAPACSRCKRNGQAALCLLHRRPYPEEILNSDATWSTTLILLKLKDEDEETWKAKLKLVNEVRFLRVSSRPD